MSHPLPPLRTPFLSVFVLSVNVLDGGLSPGKHHYSNFLCTMNDSDPLFIPDLLITPSPLRTLPDKALKATPDITLLRRRGCGKLS